jgi:hypothetical protein
MLFDLPAQVGVSDGADLYEVHPAREKVLKFLEMLEARSGVLGLMDENSTTRSNSALSPGLNPLERLAYYLVSLGTYSAK